jgi:hypothetical protein
LARQSRRSYRVLDYGGFVVTGVTGSVAKTMIWPFKRNLERDADLLVGAAGTVATGAFVKFIDEFAFIPRDERGRRYWDFFVTIAGVFIALMGLRTLNLNEKRRLKLEKKVAAHLVRLYPAIARLGFEKCKSFFDKASNDLSNAGYEPRFVASDSIGAWVVSEILGRPADTDQELTLARKIGVIIVHSFSDWWETTGGQKPVQT